jgi:uracil-DNA glycosylase family 4
MIEGFLPKEKKIVKKRVNKKKVIGCTSCAAYKHCSHGQMAYSGDGDKGILIIGDVVSKKEDGNGKPFSDICAAYLREELSNIGISLERDCWAINVVQCYSPKITSQMMEACWQRTEKVIKELNPRVILLLGDRAIDRFLQERIQKSRLGSWNVERWMGHLIPDQQYECWVVADYHPKFVLQALTERKKILKKYNNYRENKNKTLWHHPQLITDDNFRIRSLYFKKFLKGVLVQKEFRKVDYSKQCEYIDNVEEAIGVMRVLQKEKLLAWDLETTTLAPYGDKSEITHISFSNGEFSYSFPFFKENKTFIRVLKNLLLDEEIKIIIANAQFEENWMRFHGGFSIIENCYFDTVLAAHILRPTISANTSLKVNTYIYTGVLGYDAGVDDYLKGSEEKNPYSSNRIKELDPKLVGIYNAFDSLFTAIVAQEQMREIESNRRLNNVFKIYMRGQVVFADMSYQGFVVDEEQLLKNERELEQKLTKIEYSLENTPEVKEWYKEHTETFNFRSNDHLSTLFFDILGYSTGKQTASGSMSIDKDVLEEFSKTSKLAELLCEYKMLYKLKNTDLKGLKNNTYGGKIHPFYGLSQASTGRSNSSRMNFQNLNNSNPYAIKIVRSCLKGHGEHEILMFDVHALEIFGGLSHHHDPNMEAELLDSSIDAHTMMAQKVFGDNLEEVAIFCLMEKDKNLNPTEEDIKHFIKDELRKPCKNISFALAYGGSANRVFQTLWNENLRSYHKSWFKHINLGTEEKFREHSKQIFEYYWERYKVFGEWRNRIWEEYLVKGYIYNKFGFRLNGINSKTFITNAKVQGSSYLICLLANIKLWEVLKEKNYESFLVGAIHDSLTLSYNVKEAFEGDLIVDIKKCMEDYVNKKVRWLKLPISVAGEWFLDSWANEVEEEDVRKKYGYIDRRKG